MLVLGDSSGARKDLEPILLRNGECVLCPAFSAGEEGTANWLQQSALGVALPVNFSWHAPGKEDSLAQIYCLSRKQKPAFLFPTGDIPPGSELKQPASLLDAVRSTLGIAA